MLHVEAYLNNDLCEDLELEIQRVYSNKVSKAYQVQFHEEWLQSKSGS